MIFEMFQNPCISKKRLTVIAFLGGGNGRGVSLYPVLFLIYFAYSSVDGKAPPITRAGSPENARQMQSLFSI